MKYFISIIALLLIGFCLEIPAAHADETAPQTDEQSLSQQGNQLAENRKDADPIPGEESSLNREREFSRCSGQCN